MTCWFIYKLCIGLSNSFDFKFLEISYDAFWMYESKDGSSLRVSVKFIS